MNTVPFHDSYINGRGSDAALKYPTFIAIAVGPLYKNPLDKNT